MGEDSILDNGQTESRAAGFAGAPRVNTIESVEQVGDMLLAYSYAVVIKDKCIEFRVFSNKSYATLGAFVMQTCVLDKIVAHDCEKIEIAVDTAVERYVVDKREFAKHPRLGAIAYNGIYNVMKVDFFSGDD